MSNLTELCKGKCWNFSFVLPKNVDAWQPDLVEKSIVCGRNQWLVALPPALSPLGARLCCYFSRFTSKAADVYHTRFLQDFSNCDLICQIGSAPSLCLSLPPSMKANTPLWECEKNRWRRRERLRCFKVWIDQMGSTVDFRTPLTPSIRLLCRSVH